MCSQIHSSLFNCVYISSLLLTSSYQIFPPQVITQIIQVLQPAMKRLLPHLQPLVLLVFSLAHLPHLTNSQTTPNNINFPITHTTTTTFTVTRTEDFNFTTTTTTVSTITPSYCPTQSCVTSNALWTTTGGFSVAGAVVTPSAQGTNWIPVQTWAAAHQIGENVSEDLILFLPYVNSDAVPSKPSSTWSNIATVPPILVSTRGQKCTRCVWFEFHCEETADDNSAQPSNSPSVQTSNPTQPSNANSSAVLASLGL